jgi:hypothetical protein
MPRARSCGVVPHSENSRPVPMLLQFCQTTDGSTQLGRFEGDFGGAPPSPPKALAPGHMHVDDATYCHAGHLAPGDASVASAGRAGVANKCGRTGKATSPVPVTPSAPSTRPQSPTPPAANLRTRSSAHNPRGSRHGRCAAGGLDRRGGRPVARVPLREPCRSFAQGGQHRDQSMMCASPV